MIASAAALAGWGGADVREGERESDYQVLVRRMKTSVAIDDAGRVFWEAEAGVYALGVSASGDELVILDAPADADDEDARAAAAAARQRVEGPVKEKARGHLVTKGPALAVVWAPIEERGLRGIPKMSALAPCTKLVLRREGSWGVAVGMKPGRYVVTTGAADGYRWCRVRRERSAPKAIS